MRRSLANARRELDEIKVTLSDAKLHMYQGMLRRMENEAQEHARRAVQASEERAKEHRDDASMELAAVRDELGDLSGDGASGRISSDDYAERLAHLRQRQSAAEDQLGEAERLADEVDAVLSDPIAWYDDLASRMPKSNMRRDFPW